MKKTTKKTNKMTIDKLAIMVAKGFDGVEKRFSSVEKKFDGIEKDISGLKIDVSGLKKDVSNNTKVSSLILKEISVIHEDNKHFRETVASLNMDGISYDRRIENLTIRV